MSKEKIKRQLTYYSNLKSKLLFKIEKEQSSCATKEQIDKLKRINKVVISLKKDLI